MSRHDLNCMLLLMLHGFFCVRVARFYCLHSNNWCKDFHTATTARPLLFTTPDRSFHTLISAVRGTRPQTGDPGRVDPKHRLKIFSWVLERKPPKKSRSRHSDETVARLNSFGKPTRWSLKFQHTTHTHTHTVFFFVTFPLVKLNFPWINRCQNT